MPPADALASYLALARIRALSHLPPALAEDAVARLHGRILAQMAVLKAADPSIAYDEAAIKAIFASGHDPLLAAPPVAPLPVPPAAPVPAPPLAPLPGAPVPAPPVAPPLPPAPTAPIAPPPVAPVPSAPLAPVAPPALPALPLPPLPPLPGGGAAGRKALLDRLFDRIGLSALTVRAKAVFLGALVVGAGGTALAGSDAMAVLTEAPREQDALLDRTAAGGNETLPPALPPSPPPVEPPPQEPQPPPGPAKVRQVLYERDQRESLLLGEEVDRFYVPEGLGAFTLLTTLAPEAGCVTVAIGDPSGNATHTTRACPDRAASNATFVGNGTWTVRYTFAAFTGRLHVTAVHDEAAKAAVDAAGRGAGAP